MAGGLPVSEIVSFSTESKCLSLILTIVLICCVNFGELLNISVP